MRELIWKHCPACGARDSMTLKTGVSETFKSQSEKSIKVDNLSLYVCDKCGDAIATNSSDRRINAALTELKAHDLSTTVVAAEIASIEDVVKLLKVTRQAVHQMMKNGRIQYVFVGDLRFPLKEELTRLSAEINKNNPTSPKSKTAMG